MPLEFTRLSIQGVLQGQESLSLPQKWHRVEVGVGWGDPSNDPAPGCGSQACFQSGSQALIFHSAGGCKGKEVWPVAAISSA